MVVPPALMNSNLYDLIFKTILKLPMCSGPAGGFWSGWGCIMGPQNFSHDFIIALLIPHIIILIFIFLAARGLEHGGLSTLFGLSIYIFIVYSGWYPIFAQLTLLWLVATIFISTYFFIVGKFFPPSKIQESATLLRGVKNKRIIEQQIRSIENELQNRALTPNQRQALQQQLQTLRQKLASM